MTTLNRRTQSNSGLPIYDAKLRQVMEDHLIYLRQHSESSVLNVDPQIAEKGHGDLISVLQDYNIPEDQHWIILRVNGYTSPMDYDSEDRDLIIPAQNAISNILRVYQVEQSLASKK